MSEGCRQELAAFKADRATNVNKDLALAKVWGPGGGLERACCSCAAVCLLAGCAAMLLLCVVLWASLMIHSRVLL